MTTRVAVPLTGSTPYSCDNRISRHITGWFSQVKGGGAVLNTPGPGGTRRRGRLVRRTAAIGVLLSVVVGAAFAFLLAAICSLNSAAGQARQSQQVLAAANKLELLVDDVEMGLRGFIITGDPRFLRPWQAGRAAFPGQASTLERLAAGSGAPQGARVRQITAAAESYINAYSVPLVATARRDLATARAAAAETEGKERTGALREQFVQLDSAEGQLLAAQQARADALSHRAVVTAVAAVPLSIGGILLAGGYLVRRVIRPIRRASVLAGQVSTGDLSVRTREDGPAEVGTLQAALNTMTASLEASHSELRQAADEQAALRRVATLVARGVAPAEVFHAVAAETGRALAAHSAVVARYEPDMVATVVGSWGRAGSAGLGLGSRWPAADGSNLGLARRNRTPVRVPSYQNLPGQLSAWARGRGIRSSVGTPITLEGDVWGVVIVFWDDACPPRGGTEEHMLGFTELAAMAIANTESRTQLAASRARVVAAADETRRRIERNLHDGAQQRLITLGLELRAAAARLPPGQDWIGQQWTRTTRELGEVADELRVMSHGLHPVVLEKRGLGPALRAVARRSGLHVELSVNVGGRLPEPVEVAAYYVVSEALTNVAKHARGSVVRVEAAVTDGELRLAVTDDGPGGADPARGSGLVGLSDRVEALDGRIDITSPPGGGTALIAAIPVRLTPSG